MASDDEDRQARRRRADDDRDERRDRSDRSDRKDRHRSRRDEGRPRSRERHSHRRRSYSPHSDYERSNRRRSRSRDHSHERHRRRRLSRDGYDSGDRHRHRRRRDRDNVSDEDAKRSRATKPSEPLKRSGPLPSQEVSFAVTTGEEPEKPKEKPNFGNTGMLAAASNSVAQADGSAITLKYHEPAEARKPAARDQWKLFIFKDGDIVDTVELSLRSCWLVGREAAVVDLQAEHPSISKQHAVVQFRYIEKRNEFGEKKGKVKPYLIDLESANGTRLNDKKIGESRYVELRDKDMIKFGDSSREYVLMLAPKD